jgi:ABC-2 type transport system ATP-binding protein
VTTAVAPVVTPAAAPERPGPVAVRLEGLVKRFPARRGWAAMVRHPFRSDVVPALQGVTWEIREGEFFGLLGPNGAGKTTLFKILATLITPDGGGVTVAGFDVVRQAAEVRRVLAPVITDERSLNWRLSARENLRLFAALQGLSRKAGDVRVEELLEVVGLADTGAKLAGSFSSGMRQRLLIARALLSSPKILLLDEPTRSLDPVSARNFRRFLRDEISGRHGCTVLLATHNTEEAFELCERVAVLNRGRLLAVGATRELVHEFGDERYSVWLRHPQHPGLAALSEQGLVRGVRVAESRADGWTRVEMEVPGELARAADVVAALVRAGVPVARFERSALSLADLMERIIERREAEGSRA